MSKTSARRTAIVLSAALLLTAGAAEARPRPNPKVDTTVPKASTAKHGIGKGDKELGFFANFTNTEGSAGSSSTNSFLLGAVFGTYLRDTLELRITPVISVIDAGALTNYGFFPYVTLEKQFPNGSPVVPYVGGGIGLTLGYGSGGGITTSDLGLFVTPVGGLKFFVSERMSLEYALGFQYGFDYNCYDAGGFSSCNSGTKTAINNNLRFNIYF